MSKKKKHSVEEMRLKRRDREVLKVEDLSPDDLKAIDEAGPPSEAHVFNDGEEN